MTFAVIADTPYDAEETRWLEGLLSRIAANAGRRHPRRRHKSGWSPCSDVLFAAHRKFFDMSIHPLVYVAGDNDWTDCWRPLAGGYEPLERLDALRRVFFDSQASLGRRTIIVARQPEYPENVRWQTGPVTFAGFNIPGPDNNYMRMPAEYSARNAANLAWLAARSRRRGSAVPVPSCS